MGRITHIRKSVIVLASITALGAPSVAMAYPVIGDDPGDQAAEAEGHALYAAHVKRSQQSKSKPKPAGKPRICPSSKKACLKP
jgi:hypothetical protein